MGIFSKKQYYKDFQFLGNDFHAHLIPAIDDGARNISESIELIQEMSKMGFHRLVATPHIHKPHFDNTADTISRSADKLREKLLSLSSKVMVDYAAEYFADEHFTSLLQHKTVLPINNKYILFETSTLQRPYNLFDTIFEIQTAGYVPILAHPERYVYYNEEIDIFYKLKEAGCHFQANILSYSTYYGQEVQKLLNRLLKMQLVDYLCTDIHHVSQLPLIHKALKKVRMYPFRNIEIYQ